MWTFSGNQLGPFLKNIVKFISTRSCRGIFVSSFAVWGLRGWESVEVCLDGKVLEATNILNLTLAFLMLNH